MSSENVIEFIERTLIPMLDRDRALAIIRESRKVDAHRASARAHRAAIRGGIETVAIRYSERLRAAAWGHVWPGSQQVEAYMISNILSRVGMAVATIDLVGDGEYGIEDYIDLVQPWVSGFPDFPLPVKEEA